MSTYIELEIQNLLNQTEDVRLVGQRLVESLEKAPDFMSGENITALARFFLNSNQNSQLIRFVLNHISDDAFPIPWPYFLEALGKSQVELSHKVIQALIDGIEETHGQSESGRAGVEADFIPELKNWRADRKYKIHKDYINNKELLIEQLVTLRTQQLYEQEKQLLAKLQKLYPGDKEIQKEVREHKQRYALEVLQRRAPKASSLKTEDYLPKDPQLEQALQIIMTAFLEQAEQDPDMAFDFAIAAYMLESYETSLELLSFCEETASMIWLRMEVLLKCRRFVELLTDLSKVEVLLSADPETFFATAYLRAQAYWGLGQKHTATEIMEGLLASRPHYRAASSLLRIWSGQ